MTHLRPLAIARIRAVLTLCLLVVSAVAIHAADPLRVVVIVDSSTNMASMLTEFRAGLHSFVDTIPDDVEVVLVSTGGQLRVRLAPTFDKALMHAAASRFASDGGANSFLDTLLEADQRFIRPASDRRPIVIALTTDQPALSEARIDAYNIFLDTFLQRRGRAHGVVIRGVNSGVVSRVLENLTKNTDGVMTMMAMPNSLATRMRELAEQVAAQQ